MSPKFADDVVCRRHVADMSPTFPTKIAVAWYQISYLVGLGLGPTFRGEARRDRGDTSVLPRHPEPRSFEAFRG